jgi:hypothetical protein
MDAPAGGTEYTSLWFDIAVVLFVIFVCVVIAVSCGAS